MKELCRVTDHYCVECCEGRNCCLLGELCDGTKGCLGHNGKRTAEGLTETEFCEAFDCLFKKDNKERAIIKEKIKQLPTGEFRMGKILRNN